jgi:uncharacterized protein (TIGR03000 family)
MARRLLAFRVTALVAAGVLALAALPAVAGHGGYHGGHYGGYHGGYGYYHGYYGPYHGYYHPYGWWYGRWAPWGYAPYPYFGIGVGIAVGYPGYLPYGVAVGAYSPPAGVVVAPPAAGLAAPAPDPAAAAPPPADGAGAPPEGMAPPKPDGKARLMLLVPANAQVWFDGQPTSQTGTERGFVSSVLTPGKVYTYSVRVRSVGDDGRVSDETRPIQVRANDRWVVDFTRPAPQMQELPKQGSRPDPMPPPPP